MNTRGHKVASFLVLAQILAGCSGVPAKAPAVDLPAAFEQPAATGALPGTADATVAPDTLNSWWLTFGDADLTRLVEQALAQSPTAEKAKAVLQEARAARNGAGNVFLPQGDPSLVSSRTGSTLSQLGPSAKTANLTIAWDTDIFGANRKSFSIARSSFAQARFSYEATRTALAADVATSVLRIKGVQQQLADAQETVRISEELLRIAKLKAERGLVGNVDVASFEGDLSTARAQVMLLTETLRSSQRTLLILLGRSGEPTTNLAFSSAAFTVPQIPNTVPSDLVARRPDVRRDAAAFAVAVGNKKAAQLGYFPTLMLEPIFTGTKASGVTTNTWTLEGILTQPLFSLPRVRTQVKIATARQQQALIGYEQSVDTAFGEAENALAGYQTDLSRLGELASAQASAKQAFDAERLRYQAGYSDQATLLQREQAWRQATSNYTGLRTSTLVDAVTAYKALGGGWTPPASDTK